MKHAATILGLALIAASFSCRASRNTKANPYAGLWKYPETAAWVKILPDGRAFQCRIAATGKVFRSEGILTGSHIDWQDLWGRDVITRNSSGITFRGPYETSTLVPAEADMDAACRSPF